MSPFMRHQIYKMRHWLIFLVVVAILGGVYVYAYMQTINPDTTRTTTSEPTPIQTSVPTSTPTHVPKPTPIRTPISKPPKSPSNPLQAIAENAGKDIPSDTMKVTVTQKNGEVQVSDIILNLSNIVDYVNVGKLLTFRTQRAIWNKGSYKTVTVLVWFATSDGNGKLIGGMSSVLYPDTEKGIDWGNVESNYAWLMYDDTYISPSLET